MNVTFYEDITDNLYTLLVERFVIKYNIKNYKKLIKTINPYLLGTINLFIKYKFNEIDRDTQITFIYKGTYIDFEEYSWNKIQNHFYIHFHWVNEISIQKITYVSYLPNNTNDELTNIFKSMCYR